MRKDKILFIMHMPPPVHGAAVVGKYIFESKKINAKFDCTYLNPTMARDLDDLAKIRLKKIFGLFILLKKIYKIVKKEKFDICYFTPASGRKGFYKSFIIVQWLKLLKQNVVLHFHNKGISKRQHEFFDNLLFKIFFNNVKLILLSELLYDEYAKYVNKKDVYICPNGIPENDNFSNNLKHSNQSRVFQILFLSNMMEEKGVFTLLEACKILSSQGYNFKCNFVGKFSDINENVMYEKIHEYGLENFIIVHGPKYEKEKESYFLNSDLFVFPTYYQNETFGLVLLEAMQYSLPCISTFEGGIPTVVKDNVTGLLIKSKNSQKLADSIIYLIVNPEVRESMGMAGRQRFIECFTLEKFENNFCNIITTIIYKK